MQKSKTSLSISWDREVCEEDLIAVVIVVGGFAFRAVVRVAWGAVVRAARGALVVWSCLRCPVRPSVGGCDRGAGPGLVVRSRPTPLALVVRLLRVGLPLHPPPLHRTVAARVVVGACRAPGASCLAARAVPTSVGLAVGGNALPVVALVIRSWTAVSLLSVWEKVHFEFSADVQNHLFEWMFLWSHLSSAIFRPSSSEEDSDEEMIALDLIFPLRDGGKRSGCG